MTTSHPSVNIDVCENRIDGISPAVLRILLQDHSKSTSKKYESIFWATDNYKKWGPDYAYGKPITPELITGKHGKIIQPRVVKSKEIQIARSKGMAEVFTPSWVCNFQNNQIDSVWFGNGNVFNREIEKEDGTHSWIVSPDKIRFPAGKDWTHYVNDIRLEISCGEAPYIVSRYDTTTGEFIPVENRIGILDRKLRVVGENVETPQEWLKWAEAAYKATYAYEWQGDSLLLAREAAFMTLFDYYEAKFGKNGASQKEECALPTEIIEHFAEIISWNFWQMDGQKGVVPNSCDTEKELMLDLFGEVSEERMRCEGCARDDFKRHNGVYCKIMDWQFVNPRTKKMGKVVRFVDTLR